MWAKVDTKRKKRKWKMAELFADEGCSDAITEFLRTTDMGRKGPVEKAVTESTESGAQQGSALEASASHRTSSLVLHYVSLFVVLAVYLGSPPGVRPFLPLYPTRSISAATFSLPSSLLLRLVPYLPAGAL